MHARNLDLHVVWHEFDAFAFLHIGVIAKQNKTKQNMQKHQIYIRRALWFIVPGQNENLSTAPGRRIIKVLDLNFVDTPMA